MVAVSFIVSKFHSETNETFGTGVVGKLPLTYHYDTSWEGLGDGAG